jgi:hypothetical protein
MAMLVALAAPAMAQVNDSQIGTTSISSSSSGDSHAAPTFSLPANVSFVPDDQARPTSPASPTHQIGGKQVTIDVQGGFITGSGASGLDIGAGASFLPMKDNDKFGIIVDGNFIHVSSGGVGANGLYISFNGVYNIDLENSKAKPFVGGGLAIVHLSANGFGNTQTKLQILGGVGWALEGGREVNGQVRFIFTDGGTTTVILVGFAF